MPDILNELKTIGLYQVKKGNLYISLADALSKNQFYLYNLLPGIQSCLKKIQNLLTHRLR